MTRTIDQIRTEITNNEINNLGNNDGSQLEYFFKIGSVLRQALDRLEQNETTTSGLNARLSRLENPI